MPITAATQAKDGSSPTRWRVFPSLVACEHCDVIYVRKAVAPGEVARCSRCSAVLYRGSRIELDGWLALTVTAAIVFLIANLNPVVRISIQGLQSEATLWQAGAALMHGASALIAIPTVLSVILIPFLQISVLLWVLGYAKRGRRAPGFRQSMRLLAAMRPWSMVEVCLLGVLIAVIKLSGFMNVSPGPGVWATAVLMVLLTLITQRDIHYLWELLSDEPGESEATNER